MQLLDEIIQFERLFDFASRGIEEHLKNDEPEPDHVIDALIALDNQLMTIIESAMGRLQEEKEGRP